MSSKLNGLRPLGHHACTGSALNPESFPASCSSCLFYLYALTPCRGLSLTHTRATPEKTLRSLVSQYSLLTPGAAGARRNISVIDHSGICGMSLGKSERAPTNHQGNTHSPCSGPAITARHRKHAEGSAPPKHNHETIPRTFLGDSGVFW